MDRTGAAVLPLTVGDRRGASAVGRHARLEMTFERRAGRTVLVRSYAEPPLRVGGCFDVGDYVHVMLATTAPGVFGGDRFKQIVHVGPGACVRLTSQSSQQVHPSVSGAPAVVRTAFLVEPGGRLDCRWHPVIPFAGSHLDQAVEIRLAEGARLAWSDAFTAGRTARGERWAFRTLAHELKVWRGEILEYLERCRIVPDAADPARMFAGSDWVLFGTVLRCGVPEAPECLERLHHVLIALPGISAGVDGLSVGSTLVRLAGGSPPPFHHARRLVEAALLDERPLGELMPR